MAHQQRELFSLKVRLVDGEGRIIFKPDVHEVGSRLVLERQVEALLNRGDTPGTLRRSSLQ